MPISWLETSKRPPQKKSEIESSDLGLSWCELEIGWERESRINGRMMGANHKLRLNGNCCDAVNAVLALTPTVPFGPQIDNRDEFIFPFSALMSCSS